MRLRTRLAALAALALLTGTAQAADRIRIAALTLVSSSPLFIAQERGYYEEEGLDAEIVFFRAAQPVAVAIASGDADFGVTAFTAGFFNLAGEGEVKVIGAQSREEPGFEFSAYLASNQAFEAGLTSPEAYAGKSFGMTQHGSSFHLMLGLLADQAGFDLSSVRLVPLQGVPNMIAAIQSGQTDGTILPSSIAYRLASNDEAEIIGWVSERTPYQLGGLFTSTRNVEERRDLVERFVRAYRKGAADYNAAMNQRNEAGERVFGPEAEALIPIIAKYTDSTPEAIKAGAVFIDPEGRLDVGSVHEQVAWFKKEGLVEDRIDAAEIIDLSFIDGHYDLPQAD
jgi:NitT/TauT family transport system substrate-binding protein